MRRLGAVVFLLAATAASDDAIVVEGRRFSRPEAAQLAADLVRVTTVVPDWGQYARWNRPICPLVLGLAEPYGATVIGRIRKAADIAGAPVDQPKCRPNLVVAFAPDADAASRLIGRGSPSRLFQSTRPVERDRFLKSPDLPVRWVYALSTSDRSGATNGSAPRDTLATISVGEGGESIASVDAQTTRTSSSSLVETNLVVNITGALVIVDLKAAEGYALQSVGDYVARVALAQTPLPPRTVAAPTVLALFADAANKTSPIGLSGWDRAYLVALYRTPPNREGWRQRNRIVSELVNALAADPKASR